MGKTRHVHCAGDDSNYMPSTEWDLVFIGAKKNLNFFSCCPEPFPDIVITIQFCPSFHLVRSKGDGGGVEDPAAADVLRLQPHPPLRPHHRHRPPRLLHALRLRREGHAGDHGTCSRLRSLLPLPSLTPSLLQTLLSMTVFLMLVAESMPPTSDTLPLIGKSLNSVAKELLYMK